MFFKKKKKLKQKFKQDMLYHKEVGPAGGAWSLGANASR